MTREEWLKLRKNYIGASDAPIIMNGIHFNKTPYGLWEEKLGLRDETDSSVKKYGREMEESARIAYERYTGRLMNPQIVFHPKRKFMMSSLDGVDIASGLALEIKCPGPKDHETALQGNVPDKYYPQLQHQLACINLNHLHYFSFREGKGVLIEVERDESYIESLYEKEEAFWQKVLTLSAPEMSARDYQLMESAQWQQIADRWKKRQALIKSLEEEEKQDRQLLIELANHSSALGHGVRLSKIVRKGNIDYKAIPELEGIDLEKFRKKPIETWRLETVN